MMVLLNVWDQDVILIRPRELVSLAGYQEKTAVEYSEYSHINNNKYYIQKFYNHHSLHFKTPLNII